ncbi:MAG TPA: AMP-binding protein [Candidatus Dormibacteraeota bacterium]
MPQPIAEGLTPWPEELVARWVARGYWAGRTLGDRLVERADASPEAIALVDGEARFSYRELIARADGAADRLADLGLGGGDRMLVQLPNRWELVVLTLACLRLGVVPVMALPAHRRHELRALAELAEARAIAVPEQWRGFDHQSLAHELAASSPTLDLVLVAGERVVPGGVDLGAVCAPAGDAAAARERVDARAPGARDVAVFLLSGGTTGLSKLIPRTHDDYVYNATRSAELCGFDDRTVALVVLPAGHNFALACPGILGTLLAGGRVVLLASPEPERALATIAAEGVTTAAVVPAVAQRWISWREENPGDDLGSLRLLQVGGARLAPEVARRVAPVLGCTLQQVFGMAEGLLNYTRLDDEEEVVRETQGRPMCPDDEIMVVDHDGAPVPDGAPGILLTRGPYTIRGYYRAPEHNARAFTHDGWYRTGDVVRVHASGNLVVEGRDKDMINCGGEKISAEEVENLVYLLPSVRIAAAVAMPDPELGERVCVYAVLRPGATLDLDGLRASMEEVGVARYKLPARLVLVDALPTTGVGKIDKRALRADIAARLADEAPASATSGGHR